MSSKLSRLPRTRSLSGPVLRGQTSILTKNQLRSGQLSRCCSVRGLHGSVLNPRAPKIRHLNAAHALLIDLDKHIAKVQELENTVYALEQQLQKRAEKQSSDLQSSEQKKLDPLPDLTDNRLKRCLVTEEERVTFQNRLADARQKAEELSRKTTEEEANILRSWHSKKLKEVLENMNNLQSTEEALKLLPAPSQVEDDNRIFSCLNALVDIVNEEEEVSELSEDITGVEKLKNLVIERENLRQFINTVRYKLDEAGRTDADCQTSLHTIDSNRAALYLEIQNSSQLLSQTLKHQRTQDIWIFGPNPIFAGLREIETVASCQSYFVMEMLKKLDISRIYTQHHQSVARSLVNKYTRRLNQLTERIETNEAAIDKQVEAIGCAQLEDVEVPVEVLRPGSPKGQSHFEVETVNDVKNP